MSTTRHPVAWLVAVFTLVAGSGVNTRIEAQQALTATPLIVGVTGTTDSGGSFQGTLFLMRFESLPNTNGIVAVGSMAGVLNGRNIATRVAIPVTIAPTAVAAGATSCDSVHVNLQSSALRALGAVVRLAASNVEITTSQPQTSGVAATPGPVAMTTPSGIGTIGPFPTTDLQSTALATSVPSAPVGSAFPGVISPALQTPVTATATSVQPLGQLLCSVSGLTQTSPSAAQLANALNQVLVALVQ